MQAPLRARASPGLSLETTAHKRPLGTDPLQPWSRRDPGPSSAWVSRDARSASPPRPPPPAPELVPIEGKSKWAGPSGLSPTGLCRLFPVPSLTLSVVSKTHRTEEPASSPATRCVLTRGGGRRAPGGASGASPPAPCGVLTRAASGAGRPRLLPPRAHWPPASPTLGPSAPETASRSLASARPGPAPGQMPRVAAVAAADSAGGGVGGGHPARGRRA